MEFHACEPVTLSVKSLAAFLAFAALLGRFDTVATSFSLARFGVLFCCLMLLGCLFLGCSAGLSSNLAAA